MRAQTKSPTVAGGAVQGDYNADCTTDNAAAAQQYAERGIPVIPLHTPTLNGCSCSARQQCSSPGKHPRIDGGVNAASTDATRVAAWWRRWPDANIGLAIPPGYIVIDVDGHEGRGALKALDLDLPATASSLSGRPGGAHYWYKTTSQLSNRVKLLEHVDTRAAGGYVVAPPSLHHSGSRYRWSVSLDTIAEAPSWVYSYSATPKLGSVDTKRVLEGVPEGERNQSLFKLACKLRRVGIPFDIAERLVNEAATRSGLAAGEARKLLESAFSRYQPDAGAVAAIEAEASEAIALDRMPGAVPISDFLALDLPERTPLLTGSHGRAILHEHQLAFAYAKTGVGKTQLGINLACAVAAGGRIFDWTASGSVPTLYVDGEMYARSFQDRLRQHFLGIGYQSEEAPPLAILCKSLLYKLHGRGIPDLATPEGQRFIEDRLDGARLLVLDNLSSLVLSGVENEGESWLPIQEWLIRLRSEGLCVLLIHHANKAGDQRGTSRRIDALDLVLKLSRPDDYVSTQGCRFRLEFEKARDLHGSAASPLEAELVQTDNGGLAFTYRPVEVAMYERVVEMYRNGLTSPTDIAKEIGKSKGSVSKWIKKARERGEIN